ncbi:hypothetical protein NEUTE1DRAFT_107633 [Neurospora tetrasperma FGSC 2508]|uniref:Uncharacterized protein n=1 Tax=Neurospora tetrasperma (strain FGSC 2508 / ATCC MYA-4615 / P0657) TaxID=510951 RepID=F8MBB4_NEUT8|nr:uncharacterized protein NEUTE1DRAFT_107633 [Neurospora tetrasperma FGSC 2508]EGO61079.1 hypothetical protein NEUTE1DRAFT_107633 [Neurospora tetrasperma FGSC 2508]
MLIQVGYHPIYRAHLLLARGVGGIEFLPPNLQRMDKVAIIFSLYSRDPSEVPGFPSDLSPQDALRPETVFRICTAAKREFDPFITSDLGEFLARIRHVLSLVLGHPDCNDEDSKKVDDAWQCVCHDNRELLCAAWEAGRPYLGPDTKAGRARITKAQASMELKLADHSSLEPDNPSRESINEACFSSPATTAPTPEDHRLRQHELVIPNPTPPRSFPSGDKKECVKATRTALGALSLSEQNRRRNKTTSPERARRDQHEDEGYNRMSDMGHVSPENDEDDDEDLDIQNDMGCFRLPDRDGRSSAPTSESRHQNQHEDKGRIRLSDLGYVSPEDDDDDGSGGDYWQVQYHKQLQQLQQQQQQHLNPSGHGETRKMRWGHNDSSSEGMDGQMKSVEAGEYPFSRRQPGDDMWLPPCDHPNQQQQAATGSKAALTEDVHDVLCPHSYHSGCHIRF